MTRQPEHTPRQPEHTPRRPDWLCRDCHLPWPCPERRRMLAVEFQTEPVAVVLLLATCYAEAATQLLDVPPEDLYMRMQGWLASARRPQQ
jgi:hypothetical protein